MTGKTPENLIVALRDREHEAFNELVRLCHSSVFRLAQRVLQNVDDAQEVAQETFLAAYEGIEGFQERSKIKTWLLAIAYRKAMDRLKKRIQERDIFTDTLDEEEIWKIAQNVDNFTDWGPNPEQYVNSSQVSEILKEALTRVPPDSKAVFELRDLQGFSSREVSDILGIQEGTVRVRLHRVRQILMRELESLFGGKGKMP